MTGYFAPLLNMVAEEGKRQKRPMLALIGWKTGHSHCLLMHMGFWERTFEMECTGKQKVSWFFPLLWVGDVLTVASKQRPGGTDSKRCLKLDSDWRQAKALIFMPLLGGEEVPGAT